MKIFSVIVTHNAMRNNWIYKCLDSLLSSDLSTEIIVVDNASTDETCQVIKDRYPSVILIENRENKGFGAANNQGFEYGVKKNADYFFLLNQDAWVQKSTINKLVDANLKDTTFSIISPLHLNAKEEYLDNGFANQIAPGKCKNLFSDFALSKIEDKIYESSFVCAAAWLITKECVENVGGFNPLFFHYAEDENYYHRLTFLDLRIGVYPLSHICHDRSSRGNNKYFEGIELKKRLMVLDVLNPNNFIDTNIKLKELRLLKINAILLRDRKMLRECMTLAKHLLTSRKVLESNLSFSKSNDKFKFLNI